MRNLVFSVLLVIAGGIAWQCSRPFINATISPDIVSPLRDSIESIAKGPNPGFSKNQLVVFPRHPLSPEEVNAIKEMMRKKGIDPSLITIRTCNACSADVQLWEAPNIYTYVMTEGVRSGSGGGGSNGVGEDSLARYSLNFTSRLPVDSLPNVAAALANYTKTSYPVNNLEGKDVILIAVLDTGLDTVQFIHNSYVWNNPGEKSNRDDDDNNCYADDIAGWNFLANNPNFGDDNRNIHGTLVTKYIIDQFQSATNGVQILPLKTHDANGYGNLFATICALHYAIDRHVQLINASWGFYNYGDNPVPYLDSIITQVLPRSGIVFVTAAGNKIDADDIIARSVYRAMHGGATISDAGLRNLQIHNFYPAVLSNAANNVITTTTTDGSRVSPTQNYSSLYVDLGVKADNVTPTAMKFRVPFILSSAPQYISGSSFATAIATGKIGARFKRSLYVPGITKERVFTELGSVIRRSTELTTRSLVRGGRYIIPR